MQVEVGAKYMPGPCGLRVGGSGVRAGSTTTEGTADLIVDGDASPGIRPIRIHSVQGGSSPRAFVVGDFPEMLEDAAAYRQPISPRITINGRLYPKGDFDEYELQLAAGQQIVCAVAMRSLGSPGDTLLRLVDSTGRTVATGNNWRGPDPLLVWRCRTAGRFVLQIYDFKLAGGDDYVYRLTVTDGPYLDYAFPAGVQRGAATDVLLHGWNLPDSTLQYGIETNVASYETQLAGSANRLKLQVGDLPERLEREPNDLVESPQFVDGAAVINGRFQKPNDVDLFRVTAKKGDRLVIRVESERLGFRADVVLRVLKPDGQLIRETDDVSPSRDPTYTFAAPADGDYLLSLTERAGRGGPRFVYRLHVRPPQPDVRLTVKTAEFAVVPGATLTVPVRVTPLDGFASEIELVATDLPAGVTVAPVRHIPKKAGDVTLEFKAAADAQFTSGEFKIIARSTVEDAAKKTVAVARLAASGVIPRDDVMLWLAVSPKVPFDLSTVASIQEAPRLAAFPFPVSVTRDDGFRAPIRLVGVDKDRRGTVEPLEGLIPADADSGSIPLVIQSQAVEGTTHRCRVMGVADVTGPDGQVHSVFQIAKGSMAMGCQPNLLNLTSSQSRIRLKPGGQFTLRLVIERRVPCGDVTVSLLPAPGISGITADPVVIDTTQAESSMRIDVAADATLPAEFSVILQAESSRSGLPVYALTTVRLEVTLRQ